jgi:hypothetical protein
MPPGPQAEFSFLTLLVLAGMLGMSCVTFWLLVRRATLNRQWVALSDWARGRGFRNHPIADGTPPAPFSMISTSRPRVRLWLAGRSSQLLQMQGVEAGAWHVLIQSIESNWPPTALRPVAKEQSLLDLFSLASFPAMISAERFVIFGADSNAAKSLAKSSLSALLPPDIGLLLHGQHVVLDFSNRPFDAIEFDRMLTLVNHLMSHLPAIEKSK